MYRATAEAVSGTKVFAGGKWLTCIGNRSVKVGDRIWTDGRCVYGNDLEAETPIVITPIVITPNAKAGIPIQIGNYLFTFYKGNLEKAEGTYSGRILNDTKENVYGLTADIATANCYDNGDIFTIVRKGTFLANRDEGIFSTPSISVAIKKNGITLKEIPLSDLAESDIQSAYDRALNAPYDKIPGDGIYDMGGDNPHAKIETMYPYYIRADLLYAFIENENNWAFIYFINANYTRRRIFSNDFYLSIGEYETLFIMDDAAAVYAKAYYIDSSNNKTCIYEYDQLYESHQDFDPPSSDYNKGTLTENINFAELQKINYPLQDGYYFKADIILREYDPRIIKVAQPLLAAGEVPSAKLDIYSPDNKLLFSTQNLFGENFVITETAEDTYLVGIKPYANSDWNPKNGGLYICKEGKLTNLIEELKESEDEELKNLAEKIKNSYCNNYRLRKMKNIKNWWKDIQILETQENNKT